ncbi:hypothetical protein LX69_02578 [Breznakibacter xylanolyticus]|uniref:Uncharacterized protein n=1 Tax=Breznakibacter xylanolyticus TaxID=990 RepID=A0A2W7N0W7_9BACT|nr:hypothetical protein LX69_02578 [Breznakibacter xylanolyticus]
MAFGTANYSSNRQKIALRKGIIALRKGNIAVQSGNVRVRKGIIAVQTGKIGVRNGNLEGHPVVFIKLCLSFFFL